MLEVDGPNMAHDITPLNEQGGGLGVEGAALGADDNCWVSTADTSPGKSYI
jgi:hypothetical protein